MADLLPLKENPPNVVGGLRPPSRRSRRMVILAVCATAAFFIGQWSKPGLLRRASESERQNLGAHDGDGHQAPYVPSSSTTSASSTSKLEKPHGKTKTKTLPHRYRSDGLLEVNPNGTHPIFELINNAEATWQTKHKTASETLEDAVDEYYRRYKRFPPKGFEKWRVLSMVSFPLQCADLQSIKVGLRRGA